MPAENGSDTVHLDSVQLRLIAEAASGARGVPVDFVASADGTVEERRHSNETAPPGSVVIPAFTRDKVPDKPPLVEATIQAEGVGKPVDLLNLPNGLGAADAVFWSESAVEKFLIPYYASVYGNQAARAVGDLLEAFHGDRGHAAGAGAATPPAAETYALAHIPKSEYVVLSGESDIGREVAVIYRDDPTQPLTAVMLPDFLRQRRAKQG
jgi:hypothetical protein